MQEPGPDTIKLSSINIWTQNVRLIAILGNSWTSKERFENNIVDKNPRDYFDIRPHATTSPTWRHSLSNKIVVAEGAFLENYSKGGYTLDAFLNDKDKLEKWACDLPELSILHIGACDLANTGKYDKENVKKQFLKDLSHFLREWPVRARKTLKDVRRETKFDRRLEDHKWMLVKIPVWDESNGIRNITNAEFKELRRKANTALKTVRTSFWKEFRAVILSTDLQHPEFYPNSVHLTPRCQREFNRQVLSAAAKVVCEFCSWTQNDFVPAEHNRLASNCHKCDKDTLAPQKIII